MHSALSTKFMPVTKTAKRALRSSARKALVNKLILKKLEVAVRLAKRTKSPEKIKLATSLTDRAAKKNAIHKNKAARIKSVLDKLTPKVKPQKTGKSKVQKSSKKR